MSARDLIFEIGAEEIPSAPLNAAIARLGGDAKALCAEERLSYKEIDVFGSPRRLVVRITGLDESQADRTSRVKGPAVKIAFDAQGNPTKAAEGFARGQGVDVSALERVTDDAGEYVYAVIEQKGRPTADVLPGLLSRLATGIEWPKSMRWGSGEARFARPVRWLLALYGADVVPVEFAGVCAGRVTYGHRFLSTGAIEVPAVAKYESCLRRAYVEFDQTRRSTTISASIDSATAAIGLTPVVAEKVFSEVVNLVECPTVAIGRFDEAFLEVPREVLETAMQSHQRYFPTQHKDGTLSNAFIVVHNGAPKRTAAIVAGHERVIRARLADAAFFYREDLARPLEDLVSALDQIVFQEKLGTLGAKVKRLVALTDRLSALSNADAKTAAAAVRAARLAKADLVSHVVIEFPSLQGIMGRHYAAAAGESAAVAAAIPEHYLPRFAGDRLPVSTAGRLVSVADKLDTICGIFAIGMAPTGSADPYALRRGALGILNIVMSGPELILDVMVGAALDGYADTLDVDTAAVSAQIMEFFVARLEGVLRDRGHAYDTVAAVLATASNDPADALARAGALTAMRAASDAMEDLSVAFTRARNLSRPELGIAAVPALMGAEESALAAALGDAEENAFEFLSNGEYPQALAVLASLRRPIDAFFDTVLVMDPDEALRDNRLKQLNRFVALFERFADFGKLAG
ncbi:MAG: glycine--tRNA ligase subunit beta [Clostridiales bacterium]|nr:glycine--tRNA ligase subunit beta [Clostridiales bacterium]